jgi:hypothetical protein
MVRRTGSAALAALTLAGTLAVVPTVAAAGPIDHLRDGDHHEVSVVYYPDDICGPRSGWTTYDVTWHVGVTSSDDAYHLTYVENGTYAIDFDDPAIADATSQFTDAQHVNFTPGGVFVATDLEHDFPDTVRIRLQLVAVEQGGVVRVSREILDVSGCP